MWSLGRRLSGDRLGGLIALFLLAANPYFILHESLSLYESLSTTLELGWLYGLLRASESGLASGRCVRWTLVAGLCWMAGIFNKEYFKLLGPALAGLLVMETWRSHWVGSAAPPPRLIHPAVAMGAAGLAFVGAAVLGWLPGAEGIQQDIRALLRPWGALMTSPAAVLVAQARGFGTSILLYAPVAAVVLVPLAFRAVEPGLRSRAYGIAGLWLLLVVPSYLFINAPFSRYLHLSYPLVILMAACGWGAFREKIRAMSRRSGRFLLACALGLCLAIEAWTGIAVTRDPSRAARLQNLDRYQYVTGWTAGWGLRDLAEFLDRERIREPVGFIGGEAIVPDGLRIVLAPRQRLPELRPLFHDGRGVPEVRDLGSLRYFLFNHNWPAPIPPRWRACFIVEKPGGACRMILYRIR